MFECQRWSIADVCMSEVIYSRCVYVRGGLQQMCVCQRWSIADVCMSEVVYSRCVYVRGGLQQMCVCQRWSTANECMSEVVYSRCVYVRGVIKQIGVGLKMHSSRFTFLHSLLCVSSCAQSNQKSERKTRCIQSKRMVSLLYGFSCEYLSFQSL